MPFCTSSIISCNICIHSSGRISFLIFCSLSFQKKLTQQISAKLFQNVQILRETNNSPLKNRPGSPKRKISSSKKPLIFQELSWNPFQGIPGIRRRLRLPCLLGDQMSPSKVSSPFFPLGQEVPTAGGGGKWAEAFGVNEAVLVGVFREGVLKNVGEI